MKSILLTVLLLSGCVTIDEQIQREGEKQGASQDIIDAIKHGCNSGIAAGGGRANFNKNYSLYQSDADYRMRWDDAFALCKGRYEDNMRRIR